MNRRPTHYGMGMSQPEPPLSAGGDALFTVDLSEDAGPETGGQKFGRIVLGVVLMIVGVVLALACGAAFIAAILVDELNLWVWADVLGDGLLFIGALFLGVAILGFELVRRGRKARAATAYLDALSRVPGVEDAGSTESAGPVLPTGYTPPTSTKPLL